jgi:hypothetical protein
MPAFTGVVACARRRMSRRMVRRDRRDSARGRRPDAAPVVHGSPAAREGSGRCRGPSLSPNVKDVVEPEDFEDREDLLARRDDDQASSEAGQPSVEAQERLGPRGVHEGHASDVEVKFAALPVQCPRYRVFECWRGADIGFAGHVESLFRAVPAELESQEVIGHLGSAVRPRRQL